MKLTLIYDVNEVAVKIFGFAKVHDIKEALYMELSRQNPILEDDEEMLVELSKFSATLTPGL